MTFPFPVGPNGTVPPQYAQLRNRQPVPRVPLADGTHIWLATRHADVVEVLTNPVFSRHQAALLPGTGLGRSQGSGVVDLDPPAHTRLRRPIDRAFDRDRIRRWRGRIEQLAGDCADTLADLPTPVDLVSAYTAPFAGRVICELLGVHGDGWATLIADVQAVLLGIDEPAGSTAGAGERISSTLRDLLAQRRAAAGDDVATTLLDAADLDDDERIATLHGLVVSGFIGVRDLLSRHLFAVLTDEALTRRLSGEPRDLAQAVEELLRFYPSSNDGLLRVATAEVELGGTRLPSGAAVLPLVSAAARDPQYVTDPERLDIDRPPMASIAFGAGDHACPAADLARTELQVGIGALLSRYPDLRLAVPAGRIEHSSNLLPLGIHRLPVLMDPPAAGEAGHPPLRR